MPLKRVVARCLEVGINCVAITDHGTITGAQKLQELAPFKVIVGQEILTSTGEIMGLFLVEQVPSRLPILEAIARVKAQGGLVAIPHPFDRLRMSALRDKNLELLIPHIDVIEVFNSRATLVGNSAKAKVFAQKYGFLASAGSDAHTPGEIGKAWVEMPEFNDKDEFRSALAQGTIFGHRSSPWVHFSSISANLKKRFRR